MRNRVSLIVSDGTGYSVTETTSDERSITKYGLLHEYVKVSSDASGAVATAQNRLRSLSRILADGTITVKGNWALTAVGKRIKIAEPISSLTGEYVITSVSHKLGDDFQNNTEFTGIQRSLGVQTDDRDGGNIRYGRHKRIARGSATQQQARSAISVMPLQADKPGIDTNASRDRAEE